MKKKILLDIDEVFCFSGYVELINEFLHTNYTVDDFSEYYISNIPIPKERKKEFYEFISKRNQYENPQLLLGALESIKRLSKYYDICDCRNPFDMANSGRIYKGKFEMLHSLIPEDVIPARNYIFTGAKEICTGDIQIDDLVSNLNPHIGLKILFPSYHNKKISNIDLASRGIIRAGYDYQTGWQEVCKILLNAEDIKDSSDK